MKLIEQPPTSKAPADMFTGDAWWDVIYRGEEPSRARANVVRFAPGARTAWHSHGLGQTLYIMEGLALIQSRGGQLIEAHPGDIVRTPPGEEHWHGAAPDRFMIHLALWESDETTWLEHVGDDEYEAARSGTRR
ncbi:(R)-mandelonitrile lyase [Streptosporangium carneum]|uniref:Cupin n=1 Tax=Streptosporangium carneum TaxID=47481 RepID=A0A9W6I768_9ACTN|nr:cupin domain-containing protein [Streptosporangium carneum]GLK13335.1 cupin [Streptosporangium carneum]